jgi:ATP-binding cassette subfamily B protein
VPVRGDVEFRDVNFSYIEGIQIIYHFSLKVKAGQKIAIVGPTGAGKTTIVNLLMRFYEVDSGDILIDGIPTKDMPREKVHSMFSMVLQDPWVFDGTVRDNLVFNGAEVSDEKIIEACKAVGLHDLIMSLPKGYDTVLSANTGLSAGQKQQLTIARAMILDAPMVIFDEATSSVDTHTEKKIQKAMEDLTHGRTAFMIAHRLSTIRDCDLILVMKKGCIVETGTHEELLAKGGFYSELYSSQFENCD